MSYLFLFFLHLCMIQDLNSITSTELSYTILKCPLFLRLQSQLLRATHFDKQKKNRLIKVYFQSLSQGHRCFWHSSGPEPPQKYKPTFVPESGSQFSLTQTPNKEHLAWAQWPSTMVHSQHFHAVTQCLLFLKTKVSQVFWVTWQNTGFS